MILRFYKREGNTPTFIKELEVKGCRVNAKGFMSLVCANTEQVAKDILWLNAGERVTHSGIKMMRSCGDFWSSFMAREGVADDKVFSNGMWQSTISAKEDVPGDYSCDWQDTPVEVNGKPQHLELGVNCFDPGYLITSSAKITNIAFGKERAFFEKITPKWFKQGNRWSARIFKDEKALKKFLLEKEHIFKTMHSEHGYTFGFEPASSLWGHEPDEAVVNELEWIFKSINSTAPAEPVLRPLGETALDEAMLRMKDFDLYKPVQADFARSGKLYMSEGPGIIYDLNEEAEEAVRRTSEYGLPYHVIRTNSSMIGDMYAVLYVSNYPEEWDMDRFDPKDGVIYANVYNASMGIDEIGTIGVKMAHGGLIRTA